MGKIFILFFGKYVVFLVIILAVIFLFLQSIQVKKKILLLGLPSLVLSYLLAFISGKLFYDPRPFVLHHFKPLISHAANNGFPSDHALLSFTLASIIFIFNRKWGTVFFVLGLLISAARVAAGIHSAVDILGSFVISIFAVFIVHTLLKRLKIISEKR